VSGGSGGGEWWEVWWARHGENVANLSRTFSYRVFDGDLTETGRRQAAELAERLVARGAEIRLLACSPLRRARQTADILGRRLGLPVTLTLDDLREVNVGALDGRSDARSWETYAGVLAAWRAGRTRARFPGGEDYDELCTRLRRALAAVAHAARTGSSAVAGGAGQGSPAVARGAGPGPPIGAPAVDQGAEARALIVAHGANLRAALPGLAGEPDPGTDLLTGAIAALRVDPDHPPHPRIQLLSWPD
jgi:broad specificity phosphatase PhoE